LFRAPFGAPFLAGKAAAAQISRVGNIVKHHAVHIGWSCDGKDWGKSKKDELVAAYKECIEAGVTGPVLMHTFGSGAGIGSRPEALKEVVRLYRRTGFRFVQVEDYVKVSGGGVGGG
jgi:peptidoglycan/xylan/chitin deacetylase (PgdA/CDA1 family)